MGFLEDLAKNAALWGAVEASKGANGKPDPYKAAGIAAGMGNFSLSDRAKLGAMLGSQGAFDNDYSYSESYEDDDDWKLFCEDGLEYGIDPDNYDTEEEYEEAITEAKYGWREECEDGLEYGVDPEDYETEEEYNEAIELAKSQSEEIPDTDTNIITERLEAQVSDTVSVPITLQISTPKHEKPQESVNSYAARREQYVWRKSYQRQNTYGLNIFEYETEREFLQALAVAKEEFLEVARNDKTIYLYCGVVYEDSPYPYHYRTNDATLKIGDKVVVPVGSQNKEEIAEIVSIEQHSRLTVPYPIEKTKFVIRKYEEAVLGQI